MIVIKQKFYETLSANENLTFSALIYSHRIDRDPKKAPKF